MKIPRKLFTQITNGRKLKWHEKATFKYMDDGDIVLIQDGNFIAKTLAVVLYAPAIIWYGFGNAKDVTTETKAFLKGDYARKDVVHQGTEAHQKLHNYYRGKV